MRRDQSADAAKVDPKQRAGRTVRLLALPLTLFCGLPATAGDYYQWTQFTAEGLEARAITQAAACPKATIDGREASMNLRASPSDAFPNRVCALPIPKSAREAAIDGRPLALPAPRVNKIALIGDTGCRLKGFVLQDCNSIKSWPFRLAADTAAEFAPDLVLHLGDVFYRESACPLARKGCAGSPFGDNWQAWKADFFDPAGPLLGSAPWVLARGNHEDCARGGKGWDRTLDAFPFGGDESCASVESPFSIDLGGLTLAVLDASAAEDRVLDENLAENLSKQFAGLATITGPMWLAMHKPIYAAVRIVNGVSEGDNKTLAAAARAAMPANALAILSGHLHVFQTVSYADDFPAQIVSGNGGDQLSGFAPPNFDGLVINGATVEQGRSVANVFGFAMLERGAEEWRLTGYDFHGKPLAVCHLRGRKLACE